MVRHPLSIDGRVIGLEQDPFIVAEMSANHNGSLERAIALVEAAAQAGAHAIKLQTLSPVDITLDVKSADFRIDDHASLWHGEYLHSLYQQACTPWEWHAPLFARARELGIICFSSPFDEKAVDFLETLAAPAYKIASFENNHLPLIARAAATGKPLIISTGMASEEELDETVETARAAGCHHLLLLKCTSAYPSAPEDANVLTIPALRRRYACEVGLSDHSHGIGVALAAVAHQATMIEKHFTLSRADGGLDSAFSLEPAELNALVIESARARKALGRATYECTPGEAASIKFRRSLYIARDMRCGDIFTTDNLKIVRPGHGLAPRHLDDVLGRKITRDAPRGTALDWSLIERADHGA
jgi:pseudaminic acid synthase